MKEQAEREEVELEAEEAPERKGHVGHNKPSQRWAQGKRAEPQTMAKGPGWAGQGTTIRIAFTTPGFGVICIIYRRNTFKIAVLICYRYRVHKHNT